MSVGPLASCPAGAFLSTPVGFSRVLVALSPLGMPEGKGSGTRAPKRRRAPSLKAGVRHHSVRVIQSPPRRCGRVPASASPLGLTVEWTFQEAGTMSVQAPRVWLECPQGSNRLLGLCLLLPVTFVNKVFPTFEYLVPTQWVTTWVNPRWGKSDLI